MNYGRKKAAKKRKDITSKSKLKKKRLRRVRIFKGVLLTLLLLVVAGCVGGGIFIKKVIDDAPGCHSGRRKANRIYFRYLRVG